MIWGFDQKPLHSNEQGSKCSATLHFEGCPEVPLKENHAATRERFSLMTSVTSNPAIARRASRPPLHILFRGTKRVMRGLKVPAGRNISLAIGPKGSYRLEHVQAFLEWVLPPWTDERERTADWGIV